MIQRFQRHFPPPTSQFRFSPERVVDPPVFAHKIIFTSEGPLTTPPFSPAGTASGLNAHRGVNISGPQGTSSALQKPRGEWNRPSKGYSLAKYCSVTLEWGMGKFTDVEHFMHSLVDTHLDHARPRSAQDTEKTTLLREAAIKKFPFLVQYDADSADNWVINSFVARRLKWWKDRERQKSRIRPPVASRGRRARQAGLQS